MRLQVDISVALGEALRKYCYENNSTKTKCIRAALTEFLSKNSREKSCKN